MTRRSAVRYIREKTTAKPHKLELMREIPSSNIPKPKEPDIPSRTRAEQRPTAKTGILSTLRKVAASISKILFPFLAWGTIHACSSENVVELGQPKPKADAGIEMNVPDAGIAQVDQRFKYCTNITVNSSQEIPGASHAIEITTGNFNYALANADLSDFRFFVGTCDNPEITTGPLPAWAESIDTTGTSIVWVRNEAVLRNIALFFGDSQAPSIFDAKKVFLAYGSGADWSDFSIVNTNGSLSITQEGLVLTDYPWAGGRPGEAYVAKTLANPVGRFHADVKIVYTNVGECRPYVMTAVVSDTLNGDFNTQNTGLGVQRASCAVSRGRPFSLRGSKTGTQTVNDTAYSPLDTPNFIRLRREGTIAEVTIYGSSEDRRRQEGVLGSATDTHAPPEELPIFFAVTGLDPADNTRSVDAIIRAARLLIHPADDTIYQFDGFHQR